MLRPSQLNPKISAYNQIFGNFDFNKTPLAPLGTKVVAYQAKVKHKITLSDHGIKLWYIGPSMHHYHNYEFYIPSTMSTRNCPTVVFPPQKFPLFATTSHNRIAAALEALKHELVNPAPATPFLS